MRSFFRLGDIKFFIKNDIGSKCQLLYLVQRRRMLLRTVAGTAHIAARRTYATTIKASLALYHVCSAYRASAAHNITPPIKSYNYSTSQYYTETSFYAIIHI